MSEPLQGRVAKIINSEELIINLGANKLVRKGMRFKVVSDEPDPIVDPDTSEVIGIWDREKLRIEVTQVNEQFSVCSTYRYIHYEGGPLYLAGALGVAEMLRAPSKEKETFDADSHPAPLTEEESVVKIGDKVIQVFDIT